MKLLEFIKFIVFCKNLILWGCIFNIWDAGLSKFILRVLLNPELTDVILQETFKYLNYIFEYLTSILYVEN